MSSLSLFSESSAKSSARQDLALVFKSQAFSSSGALCLMTGVEFLQGAHILGVQWGFPCGC